MIFILLFFDFILGYSVLWAGGITTKSVNFRAIGYNGKEFKLSLSPDLKYPGFSQLISVDIAEIFVDNLIVNQKYFYGFDNSDNGTFTTLPTEESFNFTFGFGSGAATLSNSDVWSEMSEKKIQFFIHMGDMFFAENNPNNDISLYTGSFEQMFSAKNQRSFYQSVPIAYMWSNYDYAIPNTGINSVSKQAALSSYHQNVPHYPYANNRSGAVAPYQAFSVGSVRFLLPDLTSEADYNGTVIMSVEQWKWIESELDNFKAYSIIVFVSSKPWIGKTNEELENNAWARWPAERKRLANMISQKQITNLIMISGGAQFLAIDDGSNSDYSEVGGAGFPVVLASPLDYWGKPNGGPYSEGCKGYTWDYNEQFATMKVTHPNSSSVCVLVNAFSAGTVAMSWEKCAPFVVRGLPGETDCSLTTMPAWTWVAYVFGFVFPPLTFYTFLLFDFGLGTKHLDVCFCNVCAQYRWY